MTPTQVLSLNTGYTPDLGPEPGPDGRYRNDVIELPTLDAFGRRQFAAVDGNARELDRAVAVTDADVERARKRLWKVLFAWRRRARPQLLR